MGVQLLILDSLDELGADDFKRFQWNLTQPVLDGCQSIPKGRLENKNRQDVVSMMISSYGEESAVDVTVEILKRMKLNNEAEKLQNARPAGSKAAQNPPPTPSSSSAGPGPRADIQQRNVSADQKLFSARCEFINRVSDPVLNQLLNKLLQHGVITDAEMESAGTKHRADKAQDVIDTVRRKGSKACSVLISALREEDECLYTELNFS